MQDQSPIVRIGQGPQALLLLPHPDGKMVWQTQAQVDHESAQAQPNKEPDDGTN